MYVLRLETMEIDIKSVLSIFLTILAANIVGAFFLFFAEIEFLHIMLVFPSFLGLGYTVALWKKVKIKHPLWMAPVFIICFTASAIISFFLSMNLIIAQFVAAALIVIPIHWFINFRFLIITILAFGLFAILTVFFLYPFFMMINKNSEKLSFIFLYFLWQSLTTIPVALALSVTIIDEDLLLKRVPFAKSVGKIPEEIFHNRIFFLVILLVIAFFIFKIFFPYL